MRRFRIIITAIMILLLSVSAEASTYSRNLYRSFSRRQSKYIADYPELTPNDFANFREVTTTGIGRGKLYRSSSPVNTWGNRNKIADDASRNAGIKTFINLADSVKRMKNHKGYNNSYYSTQNILCLKMNYKYQSRTFREGFARAVKYMAESEGPYLIHCDRGKDRTGFICAVIECLNGADLNEIADDYMLSFRNYFRVQKGTKEYNYVLKNEILGFLSLAFGVKSLEGINLADAAERYLIKIGVKPDEIKLLREKLR